MNDLLSRPDSRPAASAHQHPLRHVPVRLLISFFSVLTGLVLVLAFGSGAVLLIEDVPLPLLRHLAHAPISAVPLLLIGLASLCFQVVIRPKLLDLFKAFIVSAAFILWGIDQLLPAGWEATTLGDVVILLFVIDLGWMMADRLKQQGWRKSVRQAMQPLPIQLAHCLHLLPPSPDIRTPGSDLPTRQWEKRPNNPGIPQGFTSPSSVFKRYRLLPLRGVEQTRETSSSWSIRGKNTSISSHVCIDAHKIPAPSRGSSGGVCKGSIQVTSHKKPKKHSYASDSSIHHVLYLKLP